MQIWSDGVPGKYLGDLGNYDPTVYRNSKSVELLDHQGQSLKIQIGRRSFSLELVWERSGQKEYLLHGNHVPMSAVITEDPLLDRLVYSWWAGIVDLETYERVFDLDDFTPYDDQRNPEPLTYVSKISEPFLGSAISPARYKFPETAVGAVSATMPETDPRLLNRLKGLFK